MPENTLGQSVCRIFYFWLVWLVNLNTGGPLLHCTCFRFLPGSWLISNRLLINICYKNFSNFRFFKFCFVEVSFFKGSITQRKTKDNYSCNNYWSMFFLLFLFQCVCCCELLFSGQFLNTDQSENHVF